MYKCEAFSFISLVVYICLHISFQQCVINGLHTPGVRAGLSHQRTVGVIIKVGLQDLSDTFCSTHSAPDTALEWGRGGGGKGLGRVVKGSLINTWGQVLEAATYS